MTGASSLPGPRTFAAKLRAKTSYLLDDEAAPPVPLDAAEPEPPLLLDAAPLPLPLPYVLPVVLSELDFDEDDLLALPVPPGATTVSRCSEHADSAKAPRIRKT